MSNSTQSKRSTKSADSLDLTRSIKRLSVPVDSGKFEISENIHERSALLICRDSDSKKWGPRWLKQAGLKTSTLLNVDTAYDEVIAADPDVIIVEVGNH